VYKIGICHFRIGLKDGVSLEIAKWKKILEEMGHQVYLLAGEGIDPKVTIIPQLSLDLPEVKKIYHNAFCLLEDYGSEDEFIQEIFSLANQLEENINLFIQKYSIDLLIIENIWSLPLNIPAALAFSQIVELTGIKVVAHHHDFFWERESYNNSTCNSIRDILSIYFPPKGPDIKHITINSIARDEIKKRRGIEAAVIPNVIDFEEPAWELDNYNSDLKNSLGIGPQNIIILQPTRIVARKGIELAIDLVKELSRRENISLIKTRGFYRERRIDEESKFILLFPNLVEDEEYFKLLKEKIEQENIPAMFISDLINTERKIQDNRKIYSLWDVYLFADLVTYPSLYEGWGNQFLESIRAKLPIVMFEYEVYKKDIKKNGFKVISLGDRLSGKDENGLVRVDPLIIRRAAREVIRVLTDRSYRTRMVENNFSLARKLYSFQNLRKYLTPFFRE